MIRRCSNYPLMFVIWEEHRGKISSCESVWKRERWQQLAAPCCLSTAAETSMFTLDGEGRENKPLGTTWLQGRPSHPDQGTPPLSPGRHHACWQGGIFHQSCLYSYALGKECLKLPSTGNTRGLIVAFIGKFWVLQTGVASTSAVPGNPPASH